MECDNDKGSKTEQPPKSLNFHMAQIKEMSNNLSKQFIGLLLDDGAPYSGMGVSEFKLLQPIILPNWTKKLEPNPNEIKSRTFSQFGDGEQASAPKTIIGSVMLNAKLPEGSLIHIRYLIIE